MTEGDPAEERIVILCDRKAGACTGTPACTFTQGAKAGDTNGAKINAAWHLAKMRRSDRPVQLTLEPRRLKRLRASSARTRKAGGTWRRPG